MSREWTYKKYGISLSPIVRGDLEMIRCWRNDPKISSQMIDKSYITHSQQQQWFNGLNGDKSRLYFLAYFKDEAIGVVSLVDIDSGDGTAHPSMYIYKDKFRNNIVPFCVAFALNDFAFEQLKLTCLFGKIYTDNQASLNFHKKSGYLYQYTDNNQQLMHFTLVKSDYDKAKAPITRFIRY